MVSCSHRATRSFCSFLTLFRRFTLPRLRKLTAPDAKDIPSTRCPSTRRERILWPPKVKEDMTLSRRVSVDRPSPCSARRLRPPRRLPLSLSVPSAREEDARPSRDANHSFSERRRRPRDRSSSEQQQVDQLPGVVWLTFVVFCSIPSHSYYLLYISLQLVLLFSFKAIRLILSHNEDHKMAFLIKFDKFSNTVKV